MNHFYKLPASLECHLKVSRQGDQSLTLVLIKHCFANQLCQKIVRSYFIYGFSFFHSESFINISIFYMVALHYSFKHMHCLWLVKNQSNKSRGSMLMQIQNKTRNMVKVMHKNVVLSIDFYIIWQKRKVPHHH